MKVILFWVVSLVSSVVYAESILFLGDSHTAQTFGKHLDSLLRDREHAKVKMIGSCGVGPRAFLTGRTTHCGLRIHAVNGRKSLKNEGETPLLETELQQLNPDILIVALGANMVPGIMNRTRSAKRSIEAFLKVGLKKPHTRCFWIGPPDGRNKPKDKMKHLHEKVLVPVLKDQCAFFDSRFILDYEKLSEEAGRKGDGGHLDFLGPVGKAAARRWAEAAFDWIESELAIDPLEPSVEQPSLVETNEEEPRLILGEPLSFSPKE
ncbi:MAG: hypothetical protein CL678_02590 [Bdellovibrionaceae bacterium]|nr:hypothetical protein [Pseudobdellovibrionaceae bacterium]|tara:strand:+ start:3843 stop:4634 length:792 start_codon:yes stop_codon:yes gene_type:complete